MTDEEILACLTEILAQVVDDPALALRPEQALRALPGWNGFVELSLLSVAESRFGVSFQPDDLADVATVDDLVTLIARRQGAED